MKPDFNRRVCAVHWWMFGTAYGNAYKVGAQLRALASTHQQTALTASHELWCGLCHQHAFLSSAALPAFPFIMEVLQTADEALAIEILDIILGFARCSTRKSDGPSPIRWERKLRRQLREQTPFFLALTKHSNQDVAEWAGEIVANLEQWPD